MSLSKLSSNGGNITEYLLLARVLEMASCCGQLDIVSIACLELVGRCFQLIEEKYKHRLPQAAGSSAGAESDASLFWASASSFGRHPVCVNPDLSQHIGDELAKAAAVSKGQVKAHEMRDQMRKLAKEGGKDTKE